MHESIDPRFDPLLDANMGNLSSIYLWGSTLLFCKRPTKEAKFLLSQEKRAFNTVL